MTLDYNSLKLTCILFHTQLALSKVVELRTAILNIGWGKKTSLKLRFHLFLGSDVGLFFSLTHLAHKLVHQREAYFLSLKATNLTFLSSRNILVLKNMLNRMHTIPKRIKKQPKKGMKNGTKDMKEMKKPKRKC